jgi:hypothetical protein
VVVAGATGAQLSEASPNRSSQPPQRSGNRGTPAWGTSASSAVLARSCSSRFCSSSPRGLCRSFRNAPVLCTRSAIRRPAGCPMSRRHGSPPECTRRRALSCVLGSKFQILPPMQPLDRGTRAMETRATQRKAVQRIPSRNLLLARHTRRTRCVRSPRMRRGGVVHHASDRRIRPGLQAALTPAALLLRRTTAAGAASRRLRKRRRLPRARCQARRTQSAKRCCCWSTGRSAPPPAARRARQRSRRPRCPRCSRAPQRVARAGRPRRLCALGGGRARPRPPAPRGAPPLLARAPRAPGRAPRAPPPPRRPAPRRPGPRRRPCPRPPLRAAAPPRRRAAAPAHGSAPRRAA